MDVETRVTLWCFLKQKNEICEHFFLAFFSTLPKSTQSIKVIESNFFLDELAFKHGAMNMHFNPISIL